jgi:hypothetical protein
MTTATTATIPHTAPLMWRVLEAVVLARDGVTVRDIARRVDPWTATPYRTAAERRAVLDARDAHRARARRRVAKALNNLQTRGLVQRASDPRLTPESLSAWQAHGRSAFRCRSYVVQSGYIVGVRDEDTDADSMAVRIVEALASEPGGVPYAMLLEMTGGATVAGKETGTFREAMRGLVADGWVVSGSARRATLAGVRRYWEMVG